MFVVYSAYTTYHVQCTEVHAIGTPSFAFRSIARSESSKQIRHQRQQLTRDLKNNIYNGVKTKTNKVKHMHHKQAAVAPSWRCHWLANAIQQSDGKKFGEWSKRIKLNANGISQSQYKVYAYLYSIDAISHMCRCLQVCSVSVACMPQSRTIQNIVYL